MTETSGLEAKPVEETPDTATRVLELLTDGLHVEVPDARTDLFETGLIDSLGFVELLLLIKAEFGVDAAIEDLEMDNFRSVSSIAAFVDARREAESGTGP